MDSLSEQFLNTINCEPNPLTDLGFKQVAFEQKGYAYFIQYKRKQSTVEFIFGPSDFQIEIIVVTSKGKFTFGDLLQNKLIATWVKTNKYKQSGIRNVKNEILWFVELLKYSLPLVE